MVTGDEVVVLYSGGSDSTLAICKMASEGYKIVPLICDNGCIRGIDFAEQRIEEVRNVFGNERILPTVIQFTGGIFKKARESVWSEHLSTISVMCGDVYPGHIDCLLCHSIMVAVAIGVIKVRGGRDIVDGTKKREDYVISTEEMVSRYKQFSVKNAVQMWYPVYDIEDVVTELSYYGVSVKYIEPQCYVGHPPYKLSNTAIEELLSFYDNKVEGILKDVVKNIITVRVNMR